MDPFTTFNPGDRLQLSAELHRILVGLAQKELAKRGDFKQAAVTLTPEVGLRIKNVSGAALAQFAIVTLGAKLVGPNGTDEYHFGDVVYDSAEPETGLTFAVLQEPATIDALAVVRVSGDTLVKIDLTNLTHTHAKAMGTDYEKLKSSDVPTSCEILAIDDGAATQLDGAIDAAVPSLVVDDETAFPEVPFVITIGTEDLEVTEVDGTTWTVTRAANGTTAASHADNAAVTFKSGVVWALVRLTNSVTASIVTINGSTTPDQDLGLGTAGTDLNLATTAVAYDAGVTYSAGWIVSSSGSTYRYINATPSAGNAPPNATYWLDVTGHGVTIINIPKGTFTYLTGDFTHNAVANETCLCNTFTGTVGNGKVVLPASGNPGDKIVVKYENWNVLGSYYLKIEKTGDGGTIGAWAGRHLFLVGDSINDIASADMPSLTFVWTSDATKGWVIGSSHNAFLNNPGTNTIFASLPAIATDTVAGLGFKNGFFTGGTFTGITTITGDIGTTTGLTITVGGTAPTKTLTLGGILQKDNGGLGEDVSGYSGVPMIQGGVTTNLKFNFSAVGAPGVGNDSTQGYLAGSEWIG